MNELLPWTRGDGPEGTWTRGDVDPRGRGPEGTWTRGDVDPRGRGPEGRPEGTQVTYATYYYLNPPFPIKTHYRIRQLSHAITI